MAIRKIKRHRTYASRKNKTEILKNNNYQQQQCTRAKIKNKRILIIAQEIKFARLLANNDKKIRDKVLKNLKKWLTVRSRSSFAFTETDFMSLWKGLFYCMWMSDKMLIQEDLAESLSKIIHCFNSKNTTMLYIMCALKTLAIEWFGIDQYRLDKFSLLVKRILRQIFIVCKNKSWKMEWIIEISQIFEKLFLHPKTSLGFNLHITEIFLEELAKISNGDLPEDVINEFIKPFIVYLMKTKDDRQMQHIMKHIFRYLIFQSDIGLQYTGKFEAWRSAGFPCTNVDDIQEVEISDMEESFKNENEQISKTEMQEVEKPLDPRAGRVDVELSQISFNAVQIVELLSQYKFYPSSTSKSRRQLSRLIEEFKELSKGRMPLGIKKIKKLNHQKKDINSKKAAYRLIQFEKNLLSDNMSKKKKKVKQLIEIDTCNIPFNNQQNEDNLEPKLEETIDSQNKSIDTTIIIENNLQNTDSNIASSKKKWKKGNLTCNKLDNNQQNQDISDLNLDEITDSQNKSIDTITITKSYLQNTNSNIVPPKKKWKKDNLRHDIFDDKREIVHKEQITPLKNVYVNFNVTKNLIIPDQVKEESPINNLPAKKVKIVLNRNTTQHTSEYIRQVHKSPAIPFDANKKPLTGVLKASPIPSPINPFYRKRAVEN